MADKRKITVLGASEDTPPDAMTSEQARGRHVRDTLGPIIATEDYTRLTESEKADLIRRAFALASKIAGTEAP